jgi:ADP-heptose:LPS heptosyltransferase
MASTPHIKINPTKILIIQFKYLGDAVFITPALQALRTQFPSAELHILVDEAAAPLFKDTKWITSVWVLPRSRARSKFLESWPTIKSLRHIQFDLSIDFVGNDRGAILSLLIGAKFRLAPSEEKNNFFRKLAYSKTIAASTLPMSWIKRHLYFLNMTLNTPRSFHFDMNISPNPNYRNKAKKILSQHKIICHVGTSQPKKEWPIEHWLSLYCLAKQAGYQLAFSSGPSKREQDILNQLRGRNKELFCLPPIKDLGVYLSILSQAKVLICGDTGPLHFASALGVKVIGLFGTADSVLRAAPIYKNHELLLGKLCQCVNEQSKYTTCQSKVSCMSSINPVDVFRLLKKVY